MPALKSKFFNSLPGGLATFMVYKWLVVGVMGLYIVPILVYAIFYCRLEFLIDVMRYASYMKKNLWIEYTKNIFKKNVIQTYSLFDMVGFFFLKNSNFFENDNGYTAKSN